MIKILCVVVTLVALFVAGIGAATWSRHRAEAAERPVAVATTGGITAVPREAEWASMENHHMGNTGYQMPAQMMPGAPEGDDMRLGVPITLTNDGDRARTFDLASEFFLTGGPDGPRPLHSDTFGHLGRLGPGSAADGVLYFDTRVPGPDDPPLHLVWKRSGEERHLAVRIPGSTPEHGQEHGS
ncbi:MULTISPECIES: hypothetical protein [unclassified Streptomyces]|uniref:hypothetical protein n=1 Tax=unclassified Streptomyces TaxID=2593676 RepID=UPI00340DB011